MPGKSKSFWWRFILPAVLISSPFASHGQLPAARLNTIFPAGGKAGTTLDVSVTGADLDEARGLYFSRPGITAQSKRGPDGEIEPNKFVVNIASNASPGISESRVIGRFGISNPRAFIISRLPEVVVFATNISSATAAPISPGTVVNGRVAANAFSFFKLPLKTGQRVFIQCEAPGLDSRMEPSLLLFDPNEHELERSRHGELLDFTAPANAEFILKVHDTTFRGGDEFFYRLTIGTGPQIDFVLPPAIETGRRAKITAYGRNLPDHTRSGFKSGGIVLEQAEVEIAMPENPISAPVLLSPASASVLEGIDYQWEFNGNSAHPIFLGAARGPVILEREPNNSSPTAQKISVPCEIAGQFFPAGDQDWFSFDAKKGDVFWLEVYSQRLGLPTSPFLLMQRIKKSEAGEEEVADTLEIYASDEPVGGPELSLSGRDPVRRWEAKETGAYRLQVRDLFNRSRSNPALVYRLAIRRDAPDFTVVALPFATPPANKDAKVATVATPFLRRGESLPVKIVVLRRDNFNDAIELSAEGLPPGLTCPGKKIEAGKTSGSLLLTAATNAPAWTGAIKIFGRAKINGSERVREARGATVLWNVADFNNEAVSSRLTQDFVVGVSDNESAPISIAPAETKIWETSITNKVAIPLVITRSEGFNADLKLRAAGTTAFESMKEFDVSAKTNFARLELDVAALKLPAGLHQFYLFTQTAGKYRNNPEAAAVADKAAKAAEKGAADFAAEAKAAKDQFISASNAVAEAETALKAAASRAVSDGGLAAAQKKLAEAVEKKSSIEKEVAAADARAKEAEQKKTAAAARAKEATQKAAPKDVSIAVFSAPITLNILATTNSPAAAAAAK